MSLRFRWKPVALLALVLVGLGAVSTSLSAQATAIVHGRVVEATTQRPLAGAQVFVAGSNVGAVTASNGEYRLANVPAGTQRIRVTLVGYTPSERSVTVAAGQALQLNVELAQSAVALDALVVTALGQTTKARAVGAAQQTVRGADVADTKRENFLNALQGRVAGVEVTSTSGVPGASSSITIRGVSSISSSNQPLFIVDGLPMDNKTLSTHSLASGGTQASFENRGIDFSNRAADLNPEDIESIVVLKGAEASALYGIDAANGAIVITTKRGKAGSGGLEYSNSFKLASVSTRPEIQRVYEPNGVGSATFLYWGGPYADTTRFYDNVDGFFRTALTQQHNLAFSGATGDARISYRLSGAYLDQQGVIPGTELQRVNLTGSTSAQVKDWLKTDLVMQYINTDNSQGFKGANGPLIGLLVWPQNDDAKNYLTPAGTRRKITSLSEAAELDNPYFSSAKNTNNSENNRVITNLGLTISPFSWGNLRTNLGVDNYTNSLEIVRHPDSGWGSALNGIIDVSEDNVRSLNAQTLLNFNRHELPTGIGISGLVGNRVNDYKSVNNSSYGWDFLEPDFRSINNTLSKSSRTVTRQRRLVSAFGQVQLDYNEYLYVTLSGTNDWTSTIPKGANSFFYPSIQSSFIFSDAFPALGEFATGKLRASYAEVGLDAEPYAYRAALQYQPTAFGGYGFGFTGPNPRLKPEFKKSYELGADLAFLDDRLALDVTYYRSRRDDMIVNGIRGSYGTGFILFNLNGGSSRNTGVEVTLNATPVLRDQFSWDVMVNFDRARGKVLTLPADLPETYNSDTWLYGNVRNGTAPGRSTLAITGAFYLRNKNGELLIDPTTGYPIRSSTFIDGGYDRQPDWTSGVQNTLKYGRHSFSFLVDIRKGGHVLNATEHYLTARGLTKRTLNREQPLVVKGVLRDGKENTDNPTRNNIVVVPAIHSGYYTGMSEELFIEDVNWVRLRDVTLRLGLPARFGRNASAFVTATDLFLLTNYSGLDPVVNGNTAAVGGSGGRGIDFGNFPMPRGINFGIRTSF